MVVIQCYLERDNYKVLKFNRRNSSYFKVTAAFQLAPYPKASKLNKRWGCLLGETWYQQNWVCRSWWSLKCWLLPDKDSFLPDNERCPELFWALGVLHFHKNANSSQSKLVLLFFPLGSLHWAFLVVILAFIVDFAIGCTTQTRYPQRRQVVN